MPSADGFMDVALVIDSSGSMVFTDPGDARKVARRTCRGWFSLPPPPPPVWGRTVRRAKSRLFSTTGRHGSQGPEFCTPDAVLNGSCLPL